MSFILENISSSDISAQRIARAILEEEITLQQCKETGRFAYEKRVEVEAIIKPVLEQKAMLKSIKEESNSDRGFMGCTKFIQTYPDSEYISEVEGLKRQFMDQMAFDEANSRSDVNSRITALENYIRKYPDGQYVPRATMTVQNLREEQAAEKERFIERIRNGGYSKIDIFNMFESGKLKEEDLVPQYISRRGLNHYKHGEDILFDINDELGPIRSDSTDIYFIGVPGAGKSCLLSGLLLYMDRYYRPAVSVLAENMSGKKYANELIKYAAQGLVPGSTANDERSINYIATNVNNEMDDSIYHPINFIEMSGEHIRTAYDAYNGSIQSIPFHMYLTQNNDKYFFIVVDYAQAQDEEQRIYLDAMVSYFQAFKEHGILEKTKAINLIVTKSDLLDGGTNDVQMTRDFIAMAGNPYHNLFTQLEQIYEENPYMGQGESSLFRRRTRNTQKSPKIYPFSLGEFELFNISFKYDETPSERLFRDIINNTIAVRRNT